MKTLIATLTALSLVATPVLAEQRGERHDFRESHDRYESHENHRNNDWVAPLVGALIIGGIVGNSARNNTHNNDEQYYPPETQYYPPVAQPNLICENYYVQDGHGNYALDSNFRAIVRQRCWYAR